MHDSDATGSFESVESARPHRTGVPSVITIGEPIVALLPDGPVPFSVGVACRAHPGGAEANVAVGLARLGYPVDFVGRIATTRSAVSSRPTSVLRVCGPRG